MRQRTWGPLSGGDLGPTSGLCLQSRQWSPRPEAEGAEGAGVAVAASPARYPAPASSPGLRAAPAAAAAKAAAASRALHPWLGRALLRSALLQPARGGRGREEPPRSLHGRDAAPGCAGIGRGRWKPARARRSRRVPAVWPGAGEGEEAGARRDESSSAAERRRKGGRWRGLRPGREAGGGGRGPRRVGETHRGHERGRLRCNLGPARRAHLPRFSPRRPRHPSGGWFSFV